MPSGVFTIINIPDDKVATVEADFQLERPEKIEKFQQPNGLWTVKATFAGGGESQEVFSE